MQSNNTDTKKEKLVSYQVGVLHNRWQPDASVNKNLNQIIRCGTCHQKKKIFNIMRIYKFVDTFCTLLELELNFSFYQQAKLQIVLTTGLTFAWCNFSLPCSQDLPGSTAAHSQVFSNTHWHKLLDHALRARLSSSAFTERLSLSALISPSLPFTQPLKI